MGVDRGQSGGQHDSAEGAQEGTGVLLRRRWRGILEAAEVDNPGLYVFVRLAAVSALPGRRLLRMSRIEGPC